MKERIIIGESEAVEAEYGQSSDDAPYTVIVMDDETGAIEVCEGYWSLEQAEADYTHEESETEIEFV